MDVSIIIPTLNEAMNIENVVLGLTAALGETDWEAIIVDDSSPDGTAARVREMAKRQTNLQVLLRPQAMGLSSACRDGAMRAKGQNLVFMDGDLQHDCRVLPRLLLEMRRKDADIAIATRKAALLSCAGLSVRRSLVSWLGNRVARYCGCRKIADPMSGFFAVKAKTFHASPGITNPIGFKLLFDLLCTAPHGTKVIEVPYALRIRANGKSKLNVSVLTAFLISALRAKSYRWRHPRSILLLR